MGMDGKNNTQTCYIQRACKNREKITRRSFANGVDNAGRGYRALKDEYTARASDKCVKRYLHYKAGRDGVGKMCLE